LQRKYSTGRIFVNKSNYINKNTYKPALYPQKVASLLKILASLMVFFKKSIITYGIYTKVFAYFMLSKNFAKNMLMLFAVGKEPNYE
jgi:hypothetical protein